MAAAEDPGFISPPLLQQEPETKEEEAKDDTKGDTLVTQVMIGSRPSSTKKGRPASENKTLSRPPSQVKSQHDDESTDISNNRETNNNDAKENEDRNNTPKLDSDEPQNVSRHESMSEENKAVAENDDLNTNTQQEPTTEKRNENESSEVARPQSQSNDTKESLVAPPPLVAQEQEDIINQPTSEVTEEQKSGRRSDTPKKMEENTIEPPTKEAESDTQEAVVDQEPMASMDHTGDVEEIKADHAPISGTSDVEEIKADQGPLNGKSDVDEFRADSVNIQKTEEESHQKEHQEEQLRDQQDDLNNDVPNGSNNDNKSKPQSRIGTPRNTSSRNDKLPGEIPRPGSNASTHNISDIRPTSQQQTANQSRPHSQHNGHVQEETVELLNGGFTPTRTRSRQGSAYGKSGNQTPVHLPEVRTGTPVNMVTMDGRADSRPKSRINGYLPESELVQTERPLSRGRHQSRSTENDINTSLVWDKSSRPTSKASSQIDLNDTKALVLTDSPRHYSSQVQPFSNSTVTTFTGQLSVTPMAGGSTLTPRGTELSTNCVICTRTLKDPRILPCLHSLCFSCLDALMESNKTKEDVACPACEEKISIISPEFVNNVYLQSVLSTEAAKSGESGECAVCALRGIQKPADFQCLDCVDLLCENCGFAHSATRATINHLVVSMKDLSTGEYDDEIRKRSKVKCRNHPDQPYDNYCQVCDMLICRECRLLDHMGHKYVSIEEAHKKGERKLLDLIAKATLKQQGLVSKQRRVGRSMAEIDSMEETLGKYIDKVTQEIIDKLLREKEDTLLRLKHHMDKQRGEVSEQKSEIDTELKKINTGIDVCGEVVKKGRNDEMLFLAPVMQKRLTHLASTTLDTKVENQIDFPGISLRDEFKNVNELSVFYFSSEDENGPNKLALLPGKPSMSLKLLDRIKILGPRDYMPPKITGLACTGDGKIVVGDAGNVNVKLFSSSGQYEDTLLSCKPVAIAACNRIVAVSDRFSVVLISIDKKFRRRIALENNGSVFAVAAYKGESQGCFVVLVPIANTFKVIDTKGDFIKEFPMVQPRRRGMQRTPMYLASNNQGELIFSDWGSNSIVHINTEGEILHEYRCGNIGRYNNGWQPGGMSVDFYDNIVIADQQNGELFILNKDLRIIYKRKMTKDGIIKPLLISSDGQGHYIVAGKGGSVNVYIAKYS